MSARDPELAPLDLFTIVHGFAKGKNGNYTIAEHIECNDHGDCQFVFANCDGRERLGFPITQQQLATLEGWLGPLPRLSVTYLGRAV